MSKSKQDLFCFFSGFARQDIKVLDIDKVDSIGVILIKCLNNGMHQINTGEYIQLNGVLFEITDTSGLSFTASTTVELLKNTSMERVLKGSKLTLGILAEKDLTHDCWWMLQPTALGSVVYNGHSVLTEHQHTLKLDFEAPFQFMPIIKENYHLGLSGSSLTAKEVEVANNLVKFSIYCGKETREETQFNQNLPLGTEVTITEAAAIEHRK